MPDPKIHCKRIVIYAKDIEILTGNGLRASQILLQRIKSHLGKKKHQLVTISEFCSYMGLNEEYVRSLIV